MYLTKKRKIIWNSIILIVLKLPLMLLPPPSTTNSDLHVDWQWTFAGAWSWYNISALQQTNKITITTWQLLLSESARSCSVSSNRSLWHCTNLHLHFSQQLVYGLCQIGFLLFFLSKISTNQPNCFLWTYYKQFI